MNHAVCCSAIGGRPNHEDNFWLDGRYIDSKTQRKMPEIRCVRFHADPAGPAGLYAISDGMGGHNAGETASRMCVEAIGMADGKARRYGNIRLLVSALQSLISGINRDLCAAGRANPELRGMGATLVMLASCRGETAVLNIGDSRAYCFDGKHFTQITRDHTEGQRMLDLGILSRKELPGFPARKHLNRYLGMESEGFSLKVDVYYPDRNAGVIFLCSDGVNDALSDTEIKTVICENNSIDAACGEIVRRAATSVHSDNVTAMLIETGR